MEIINLADQSNYRLNDISKTKDYFNEEIRSAQSLTNNNVKWLNEKHLENNLGHSILLTLKYKDCFKKQRWELINCKYQPCRRFIKEDLAIQLIMNTRTIPSIDFKNKLGFNSQDPTMTQEQSILTKIKDSFSTEKIIFQHFVLEYRIDPFFFKIN